jgi:hypothetical protein
VRFQYLNPIIINHYDYQFETQLTKNNTQDIFSCTVEYEQNNSVIPFRFIGLKTFDKEQTVNIMGFYGRACLGATRRVHFKKYMEINAALLKVLREEYHLD